MQLPQIDHSKHIRLVHKQTYTATDILSKLNANMHHGRGNAPCPVCQPEGRKTQTALSITENGDKVLLSCHKTQCSYSDIIASLGFDGDPAPMSEADRAAAVARREQQVEESREFAQSILRDAKPAVDTPVQEYLKSRLIDVLPDSIQFIPNLYHAPTKARLPAMVCSVSTGGIHRTYIGIDTNRKLMLGPCAGGAVILSQGDGPLVVTEGIETGLSVLQMMADRNPTVWAALSTSGIMGLHLPQDHHELIIASDGDDAGMNAALTLQSSAKAKGWEVGIMQAPKGQDWNDVLQAGGTLPDHTTNPYPDFETWQDLDLNKIPRLSFVYSNFYAKGYFSLTVAPPKVGKSLMALAEAVDIATGFGFLTGIKRPPQKTLYYNAEDDLHSIHSRVAAILQHYKIPQSAIKGKLSVISGIDYPELYLIGEDKSGIVINEHAFEHIEEQITTREFNHLVFDPLQDMSHAQESNDVFRALGRRLRLMASTLDISIGVVHHTRKGTFGQALTIDDARGGSALRGTSRFNRILSPMSEQEAVQLGVDDHRNYFRIGEIEANLAPPSSDVNKWFQKLSVIIPNGADVATVAQWTPPDAFDGISTRMVAKVRHEAGNAEPPYLKDKRADNWIGNLIASEFSILIEEKARIENIINELIKSDVLRVEDVKNIKGNTRKAVRSGENDPLVE